MKFIRFASMNIRANLAIHSQINWVHPTGVEKVTKKKRLKKKKFDIFSRKHLYIEFLHVAKALGSSWTAQSMMSDRRICQFLSPERAYSRDFFFFFLFSASAFDGSTHIPINANAYAHMHSDRMQCSHSASTCIKTYVFFFCFFFVIIGTFKCI